MELYKLCTAIRVFPGNILKGAVEYIEEPSFRSNFEFFTDGMFPVNGNITEWWRCSFLCDSLALYTLFVRCGYDEVLVLD